MNVTNGTGTAYPSGAPEFIPVLVGFVLLGLLFSVKCFVDRCLLYVCILISLLVSSNSSHNKYIIYTLDVHQILLSRRNNLCFRSRKETIVERMVGGGGGYF